MSASWTRFNQLTYHTITHRKPVVRSAERTALSSRRIGSGGQWNRRTLLLGTNTSIYNMSACLRKQVYLIKLRLDIEKNPFKVPPLHQRASVFSVFSNNRVAEGLVEYYLPISDYCVLYEVCFEKLNMVGGKPRHTYFRTYINARHRGRHSKQGLRWKAIRGRFRRSSFTWIPQPCCY